MRRKLAAAALLLTLTGALGAGLTGCNILGPLGYFALGPEKVPAMHQLDKTKPLVVVIDDKESRVPERSVRQRIAKATEDTLLKEKIVTDVIASDGAMAVMSKERFGKPMGVAEIGEAVGARLVVWAAVDSFSISGEGDEYSPKAAVRVKVVDVETRKRLWPTEEPGYYALTVAIPPRQGLAPSKNSEVGQVERDLADRLGVGIAKLFYSHERVELGERLGERSKETR